MFTKEAIVLKMQELYERSNIYELLLMQEANRMSVVSNKEYIKFLKTKYKEIEKTNSSTVDTVDVVRCKDCRHWDREDEYCIDGEGLCGDITEDDFCSNGERKNHDKRRSNTDINRNASCVFCTKR